MYCFCKLRNKETALNPHAIYRLWHLICGHVVGECKHLVAPLNLTQNELRMSKRNFPQRHLAYQPQHLSFRGNLKSMENVSKKLLSLELL